MLCILVNDTPLPITNMFDIAGDMTTDAKQACSVVAQAPNGEWLVVECREDNLVEIKVN